jgi:hypothetical protein
MVAISPIQMVGSAFYAPQTLDDAPCCTTHKEHHSCNLDSFCIKRNRHLAQYHTFADCVIMVESAIILASAPGMSWDEAKSDAAAFQLVFDKLPINFKSCFNFFEI